MPSSACDWSSDVCSRSEEHTSELQSHSEISYPVFCLKNKIARARRLETPGTATRPSRLAPPIRTTLPISAIKRRFSFFFFFNDTATTEIYTNLNTLSLHDALPI